MSRVRVHNFSISLDGFGTGEGQSLESPFGHAGRRLNEWFFPTRTFQGMQGKAGSTGIDDAFASHWGPGIGAEIMGAGKFGPPGWHEDPEWKGWWGPNPPFHTPTFVLTHHPAPVDRDGGQIRPSTSSTPAPPRLWKLPGKLRAAWMYESAEGRQRSVSSWQPISLTTCTSLSCPSSWDAGSACGTVSGNWSSASRLRQHVRPAALPISPSLADSSPTQEPRRSVASHNRRRSWSHRA